MLGRGNLGARRSRRDANRTSAGIPGTRDPALRGRALAPPAPRLAYSRSCSITLSPDSSIRERSSRHASASRSSTARKPRPAVAIVRRKIRAAEKRLALRRQPHRHGPAAAARRGLHEQHVHAVHVRPLFAIHFDGHEVLVQARARSLRSQTTRAPSRGTNGRWNNPPKEKSACLLAGRFFERLLAPGIPVHRVVGVLQQIGALFVSQAIGWHVVVK